MKADTSIRGIQLLTCPSCQCTRIHSTANCRRVNSSSVQDQRSNRPSSREMSRSQDGATDELISHFTARNERLTEFSLRCTPTEILRQIAQSIPQGPLDISGLQCATVSNVK